MLLSAIAFTIMNTMVKYLDHIGTYQLIFFRAITSLFLCVAYLRAKSISVWGNEKKWLILRGIVGTISLVFFFMAIKLIPFGTAVTLRYLSPIFAAIIAFFFLGDRIKSIQWFFFIMAFSGAAIIKGVDLRVTTYGFILILISAFFSGLVYPVIKVIGKRDHPFVIVGYFMAVAMVIGFLFSIPNWVWPEQLDWILLFSLGIFGFFGQIFMTMAIQAERISKVIPFKYTESLLALLVGLIWFGETFTILAIVGIVLVVAGMVLNVMFSK